MNTERPTPRTDAAAWTETNWANAVVAAEFARTLERELAEAREELARLKAQPQPLPRPDRAGWRWRWLEGEFYVDGKARWTVQFYGEHDLATPDANSSSKHWLPATPPPAPEKGVEG